MKVKRFEREAKMLEAAKKMTRKEKRKASTEVPLGEEKVSEERRRKLEKLVGIKKQV